MMKLLVSFFLFFSVSAFSQSIDEKEIRKVLTDQTSSWNQGNLDAFMQGYWKSDSLMFIGKSGVTHGWKQTLDNYKNGYPDAATMGKLSFEIIQVKKLSPEFYHVVGKWMLKRSIGDLGGHYTLLFKKIKNKWVIITDHSS